MEMKRAKRSLFKPFSRKHLLKIGLLTATLYL